MEEYLCITVLSRPGETEAEFSSRLSELWTRMLRERKEDFEKVYAETTKFEEEDGILLRQYLVEEEVVDVVIDEIRAAGVDHEEVDPEDRYTRYEAAPPEWMQIEH